VPWFMPWAFWIFPLWLAAIRHGEEKDKAHLQVYASGIRHPELLLG